MVAIVTAWQALGSMGQGLGLVNRCGSHLSLASSIRVGLSGPLVSLLAKNAGAFQPGPGSAKCSLAARTLNTGCTVQGLQRPWRLICLLSFHKVALLTVLLYSSFSEGACAVGQRGVFQPTSSPVLPTQATGLGGYIST